MKDYSEFFTHVVANHLHKLVSLVGSSHPQKVLVHEWVLGIESNWRAYVITSKGDDSEFIPRLSFWIGGLRDQFNSNPSKSKVIELLNETFDASTFCYFDYGARSDVEEQIEKYCKEVDDWFGEEILTPKLRKFRLSKKVIPLINSEIKTLQRYGTNLSDSKIGLNKDIRDASGLEKEFSSMFKTISREYVKAMKTNVDQFLNIKRDLDSFLNSCNELGYKELSSKKQLSEIEEIKELIKDKNSLKSIVNDNFDKIKEFEAELPEPGNLNSHFTSLFSNSLVNIKPDKILLILYNRYIDLLKKNPKEGNKIIENIDEFVEDIPNKYSTKNIQTEFNKIKDKAFLKVKIVNLFRIPKEEIEVRINKNSKKLKTKLTDENGEVMFENIPQDELSINITIGDKDNEYGIKIEDYYNEKTIWLFSL
ncbi:hypothetical protein ISS04_03235 [Candidatus Woesearchaeota archaeon]|nr:hypothetical protein [Candidatus Woesearchaeota archaeon]